MQETASNPIEPGSGAAAFRLTATQLLRVARGFSCFFWGLPLGLLLFSSEAVGIQGAVKIRNFTGFRLPAYAVAGIIMYLGALNLYRAGRVTRHWRRYVRYLLFLIFLQLYFAPFYHWWDRLPNESFYMLNVLALLLTAILALYFINQAAALAGLATNDETFYIEARLCGWAVVALMVFPYLIGVVYSLQASWRFGSSIYLEFARMHQHVPPWIHALFLLPFVLTMASCWKAKESCIRYVGRLEERAAAHTTSG